MNTYVYGCDKCDVSTEVQHDWRECDTFRCPCPQCGKRMHRIPQLCGVKVAFRPGYFPQLEQQANGKKSRYGHCDTERELHTKASRNGMTVNKIGF